MIILFSTASGRLAIEDAKTRSSYFIKQLCEELKKPERRTIVQESFTLKLKMYLLSLFFIRVLFAHRMHFDEDFQDYDGDNKQVITQNI